MISRFIWNHRQTGLVTTAVKEILVVEKEGEMKKKLRLEFDKDHYFDFDYENMTYEGLEKYSTDKNFSYSEKQNEIIQKFINFIYAVEQHENDVYSNNSKEYSNELSEITELIDQGSVNDVSIVQLK